MGCLRDDSIGCWLATQLLWTSRLVVVIPSPSWQRPNHQDQDFVLRCMTLPPATRRVADRGAYLSEKYAFDR